MGTTFPTTRGIAGRYIPAGYSMGDPYAYLDAPVSTAAPVWVDSDARSANR